MAWNSQVIHINKELNISASNVFGNRKGKINLHVLHLFPLIK